MDWWCTRHDPLPSYDAFYLFLVITYLLGILNKVITGKTRIRKVPRIAREWAEVQSIICCIDKPTRNGMILVYVHMCSHHQIIQPHYESHVLDIRNWNTSQEIHSFTTSKLLSSIKWDFPFPIFSFHLLSVLYNIHPFSAALGIDVLFLIIIHQTVDISLTKLRIEVRWAWFVVMRHTSVIHRGRAW